MTRQEFVRVFGGLAASRYLRGDQPVLSVSGMDHVKVRVASSGASAMFYYGLFGVDIIPVRNSTFPESIETAEFFLKIGTSACPYLTVSQIRVGESPGLDHISVLANDLGTARSALLRSGITLVDPDTGFWFHDTDGTLIELMAGPTWGIQAQSIRLPLPSNLRSVKPAFEAAALAEIHLGTPDVSRSTAFYGRLFGPSFTSNTATLKLKPAQKPGLGRLVVAIRNLKPQSARRILAQRGIQSYSSPRELLFRDPDGNEMKLVAAR